MIKNEIEDRLWCPNCKKRFLHKDRVFMDDMNTVMHQKCYNPFSFPIIDRGTYKEIIRKYEFFHKLA